MRWTECGRLGLACVLASSLACEVTTTLGRLDDEVGGSGSGSGGSDTLGSESVGSESGSSGSDTLGGESGSQGESGPGSSDSGFDTMGDPTMGETGPEMCMPMPGDDVCMVCQAELCCFEVIACMNEPSCACMLDCEQDLPPPECGMFCMPDFEYFALLQCRDGPCAGVC